jgi:hypothetical protein
VKEVVMLVKVVVLVLVALFCRRMPGHSTRSSRKRARGATTAATAAAAATVIETRTALVT